MAVFSVRVSRKCGPDAFDFLVEQTNRHPATAANHSDYSREAFAHLHLSADWRAERNLDAIFHWFVFFHSSGVPANSCPCGTGVADHPAVLDYHDLASILPAL